MKRILTPAYLRIHRLVKRGIPLKTAEQWVKRPKWWRKLFGWY